MSRNPRTRVADPNHPGQNENRDCGSRRKRTPGSYLPWREPHGRLDESRQHPARVPDDWGRGEYGLVEWLCHARRERLHKTGSGPDAAGSPAAAKWPLERLAHLLETSRPGVFAVGDVRCGNVKRVASAVGEGSIAISFVHRVSPTSSQSLRLRIVGAARRARTSIAIRGRTRIRVPVLYLHPGFHAFQAIRTDEFLQISWTFRTACTFKSSLPQTITGQYFTASMLAVVYYLYLTRHRISRSPSSVASNNYRTRTYRCSFFSPCTSGHRLLVPASIWRFSPQHHA